MTGEISDWRTFPQLYVNGELVGGCDIVEEMFESGELSQLVGVEQPEEPSSPSRSGSSPAAPSRARRSASSSPSRRQAVVAACSAASSFTWKDEPQPQAATTFGLLTTNPAPWRPST